MSHDEIRGKVKQATGRVKEAAGVLIGDKKLEHQGAKDRIEGVVQENLGKATRKVGELKDALAEVIKD